MGAATESLKPLYLKGSQTKIPPVEGGVKFLRGILKDINID